MGADSGVAIIGEFTLYAYKKICNLAKLATQIVATDFIYSPNAVEPPVTQCSPSYSAVSIICHCLTTPTTISVAFREEGYDFQ